MPVKELQPCGTVAAYDRHRRRGEKPCQPCNDANNARSSSFRERKQRGEVSPPPPPKPCGTEAAYRRHRVRGETPCEPCKAAKREYDNAHNRAKGMSERKRPPQTCGTIGGYRRHLSENEPACDDCKAANRDYDTACRRRNGIKPAKSAKCGTRSGYHKHRRNGEEACRPCKQAMADSSKPHRYWKHLWDEQNGTCPLCFHHVPRVSDEVHVDHIHPRSKGGSDTLFNLQAVHAECNQLKHDFSDDEARERIAEMIASGDYSPGTSPVFEGSQQDNSKACSSVG